jgi:hypothetical protein
MTHDYIPHQLDPDEMLRTMPAGWDLSALAPRSRASLAIHWQQEENGETPPDWQPEKFGSPRTTPRWWDVSNLR